MEITIVIRTTATNVIESQRVFDLISSKLTDVPNLKMTGLLNEKLVTPEQPETPE